MAAAVMPPILPDARMATRPANHSSASAPSGQPLTGNRPVQFGIAVSRKPAMLAAM